MSTAQTITQHLFTELTNRTVASTGCPSSTSLVELVEKCLSSFSSPIEAIAFHEIIISNRDLTRSNYENKACILLTISVFPVHCCFNQFLSPFCSYFFGYNAFYCKLTMLGRRILTANKGNITIKGTVDSGCRQGVISPLLWYLMVNDPLVELSRWGFLVSGYADDILIIAGVLKDLLQWLLQSERKKDCLLTLPNQLQVGQNEQPPAWRSEDGDQKLCKIPGNNLFRKHHLDYADTPTASL